MSKRCAVCDHSVHQCICTTFTPSAWQDIERIRKLQFEVELLKDSRDKWKKLQSDSVKVIEKLEADLSERMVQAQADYNYDSLVSEKEMVERKCERLAGAIREHKEQFPDEALNGEKKLWSVLEEYDKEACDG